MSMTTAQVVTEICDAVGKNESASSLSGAALQTRVLTYLNWAQRRIARFHSFYELNTTKTDVTMTTDTWRYPLETGAYNLGLTRIKDIHSIRLVDSENSRKLERWSYRVFDRKFPRPENYTSGRPEIYARFGNTLEFFRVPDSGYTLHIRYSKWAADLTLSGSNPEFDNKDALLVTAGVFETYMALEEYTDAKIWFEKLKGQLIDARDAEASVDWSPEGEGFGGGGYISGTPWLDPFGSAQDPLSGYPE